MRKKMLILGLLVISIVALVACGSTKNSELEKKLDDVIMNCSTGFNGSILIATDGKIILEKGYGMADAENKIPNKKDTTYTIFSVTKQFTAMAIMILEERGKLSLEDPISKYIPNFKNGDKIKIHHLLSMTSGIGDYLDVVPEAQMDTMEKAIKGINDLPTDFEPGKKFEYSNSNYFILGYIIEKISGMTYGDFLKENIFLPLKMKNTWYDPVDKERKNKALGYISVGDKSSIKGTPIDFSIVYSAGGINSSIEDLFKWDQALYSEKLVKRTTLEKMFEPNIDNYGYGWFIDTIYKNCVFHDGAYSQKGYRTLIERYLDNKTTFILLTNEEDKDAIIKVYKGLHKILEDEKIIIKN